MKTTLTFLLPFLIIMSSYAQQNGTKIDIMGLFSFAGATYSSGLSTEPGFRLAIDEINENMDLLPGYVLNPVVANSGCNKLLAIESFMNLSLFVFGLLIGSSE